MATALCTMAVLISATHASADAVEESRELARQGDLVAGVDRLQRAIVESPHAAGPRAELARIYSGLALYSLALQSTQQALDAGADSPQLLQARGDALLGLGLWSGAMVCGGVWGVLAWGAYFLWDPKVIWSVILWIHYAMFVHVRLTPSVRSVTWLRPALALVGLVWVLVAYVGTSFFFGGSSHAF